MKPFKKSSGKLILLVQRFSVSLYFLSAKHPRINNVNELLRIIEPGIKMTKLYNFGALFHVWDHLIEVERFTSKHNWLIASVDPRGNDATKKNINEVIRFVVDPFVQVSNFDSRILECRKEFIVLRIFREDDNWISIFNALSDVQVHLRRSAQISRGEEEEHAVFGTKRKDFSREFS